MGVGLPFGVGAKAAKPDKQVVVLHGDGSFGLNVHGARHGGPPQAADPGRDQPQRRLDRRPGRQEGRQPPRLHALRQDGRSASAATANMSRSRRTSAPRWSARRRRIAEGKMALVNVVTDAAARAQTATFAHYRT